jgi:hypothetical protein
MGTQPIAFVAQNFLGHRLPRLEKRSPQFHFLICSINFL